MSTIVAFVRKGLDVMSWSWSRLQPNILTQIVFNISTIKNRKFSADISWTLLVKMVSLNRQNKFTLIRGHQKKMSSISVTIGKKPPWRRRRIFDGDALVTHLPLREKHQYLGACDFCNWEFCFIWWRDKGFLWWRCGRADPIWCDSIWWRHRVSTPQNHWLLQLIGHRHCIWITDVFAKRESSTHRSS